MAQLGLATNAGGAAQSPLLCSGDSEPGNGNPTLSVCPDARGRLRLGFLSGNARAVIAEGMGSLSPYIDALFTTHETMDQMWHTYPGFHNHVTVGPATRTPALLPRSIPTSDHPASDRRRLLTGPMVAIASLSRMPWVWVRCMTRPRTSRSRRRASSTPATASSGECPRLARSAFVPGHRPRRSAGQRDSRDRQPDRDRPDQPRLCVPGPRPGEQPGKPRPLKLPGG